jgi:hypothetical protein
LVLKNNNGMVLLSYEGKSELVVVVLVVVVVVDLS